MLGCLSVTLGAENDPVIWVVAAGFVFPADDVMDFTERVAGRLVIHHDLLARRAVRPALCVIFKLPRPHRIAERFERLRVLAVLPCLQF